jgi:large subunit ribosomal protein L22
MEVKANLRYLRMAPRKVRLVADLIRGKSVEEAEKILSFTTKRAALPLLKLLKSAMANAKHNFNLNENNLFVSKILVNEGPRLKMTFPRSRGRADIKQKKMSHVTLILSELPKGEPKPKNGIKKKERASD